jgi:hypothetical protein
MHLFSTVNVRTNPGEATTPSDVIRFPRLEVARLWALPLGLFVVLCLRHVVACAL